jgi:hypothetical protein
MDEGAVALLEDVEAVSSFISQHSAENSYSSSGIQHMNETSSLLGNPTSVDASMLQ